MEDQTKLIREIFEKEINQADSWAPYYAHKLLNVSDPENWYSSDKIICEMCHPKYWNGPDKDTVRILFKSYDDFMMYRDFKCYDFMMYRDFKCYSLDGNWKFCMEHYFNKLPDTVNVEWLYEHGYVPF